MSTVPVGLAAFAIAVTRGFMAWPQGVISGITWIVAGYVVLFLAMVVEGYRRAPIWGGGR